MKKQATSMIKKNNELRKQLTDPNRAYYEKMLTYIRLSSWFHMEEEVEEALYEILQDLIDAQNEGMSAESFFGKNPKESADELLRNTEMRWTKGVKFFGLILSFNLLTQFIMRIFLYESPINLLAVSISSLVYLIVTIILFFVIKKSIYRNSTKYGSTTATLIFFAGILGIIALTFLIEFFTPEIWLLYIPSFWRFTFLVIGFLSISWLTGKAVTNRHSESPITVFLPLLWGIWIVGFLNALPQTSAWMTSSPGILFSVIILFISQLLGSVLTKRLDRQT